MRALYPRGRKPFDAVVLCGLACTPMLSEEAVLLPGTQACIACVSCRISRHLQQRTVMRALSLMGCLPIHTSTCVPCLPCLLCMSWEMARAPLDVQQTTPAALTHGRLLCIPYTCGSQAAPPHPSDLAQVRDDKGRKMSKSLGNVVDPLDVIDQYSCDALRFTLATGDDLAPALALTMNTPA